MKRSDIADKITARATNGANRVDKERELWAIFLNESCKLYEVKEIDVNLSESPNYLTQNFNGTGLGINNMDGFAICNGQNGTKDRRGRTSIGYDPSNYATIGAEGGEKEHILSAAETPKPLIHVKTSQADNGETTGDYFLISNTQQNPAGLDIQAAAAAAAHNNMQPYIVTLFVQRIA